MADWPLYGDGQRLIVGTTNTSYGVSVSPTTANTKSSWVEVISSTASAQPARGFLLCSARPTLAAWDSLFDVGIGGAGSEQVIVLNVPTTLGVSGSTLSWFFPIHIPALTRVALRMQSGFSGTLNQYFNIHLIAGGATQLPALAGAEGVGANTADSGGTAITSGNGSKSSWVQISSSAARNYKGFWIGTSTRSSVLSAANILIDVGIGAAAAEQIILPDYYINTDGSPTQGIYAPVHIPQGSRIAVRAAGSAAINFDVTVVGFY